MTTPTEVLEAGEVERLMLDKIHPDNMTLGQMLAANLKEALVGRITFEQAQANAEAWSARQASRRGGEA